MDEIKLDFKSSYIAAYLFLDNLYDKYVNHSENLSGIEKNDFGILMGIAFSPMGWTVDWQRGLTKFYGREINSKNMFSIQISPRDTFAVVLHYVTMFQEQFGCPCQFLIDILNGMLNSLDNYKDECKMWENAITNAFTGNHSIERSMWG